MIDCEKCGKPNDTESPYCIECGERLRPSLGDASEQKRLLRVPSHGASDELDPPPAITVRKGSQSNERQPNTFGRVQLFNKELYQENAQRTRRTLSKSIRSYLKDPNPDNVHYLRTAARRARACLQVLPRSSRKRRRTRKYSSRLDELIRSNAGVRDVDIIVSKITKRSDRPIYEKLESRLGKLRRAALGPALRLASSMKIPVSGLIRADDVSDEPLQKRFDRVTRKAEDKIRRRLPLVLENPANKKELHRLREDSRRLRYILDLGGTPSEREPMPLLRSWQDVLGMIHDNDIMIDWLNRVKRSPEVQDLLRDEVAERNLNYERFASMASTRIVLRLSGRRGRKAARRLAG